MRSEVFISLQVTRQVLQSQPIRPCELSANLKTRLAEESSVHKLTQLEPDHLFNTRRKVRRGSNAQECIAIDPESGDDDPLEYDRRHDTFQKSTGQAGLFAVAVGENRVSGDHAKQLLGHSEKAGLAFTWQA